MSMSGISYHELQGNAPKNSPAQRKQFLVVCTIGLSVFLHSIISAGIIEPVSIYDDGVYPGGEYVYKMLVRDYAASMGAIRLLQEDIESIRKNYVDITDVRVDEDGKKLELDLDLRMDPVQPFAKDSFANLTYSVFMDDTNVKVGGGNGRFCAGILLDPNNLYLRDQLLEINSAPSLRKDDEDSFWSHKYAVTTLPNVRAVIVTFPSTNGFTSALIQQYKVFPAMVKFAQEHNLQGPIVISSRCDLQKSICTHYIPLEQGETFLMGQSDSATYAKTIPPTDLLDISPVIKMIKSTFGFGSSSDANEL